MTREEMLERMSTEELIGWMAYYEVYPFGEQREDLRAGIMWSSFATANSDPKKHPNGIGLDKYPLFKMQEQMDRPERKATPQSLLRALQLLPRKSKPS